MYLGVYKGHGSTESRRDAMPPSSPTGGARKTKSKLGKNSLDITSVPLGTGGTLLGPPLGMGPTPGLELEEMQAPLTQVGGTQDLCGLLVGVLDVEDCNV